MTKVRTQAIKFTIVGGLNFVFTFILFYLLVRVIRWNYLLSLVAVSLLGMLLTYVLNYAWVFKPEQTLAFRGRLVKYILTGVLSLSMNVVALKFIVDFTGYDPFLVQTALIPVIVVVNFSAAKWWSLKATTAAEP